MYKNLHSQEFHKEINGNKNVALIDVRTPAEYHSGKIPGALNVDVMDYGFLKVIAQFDKTKTYYIYCRSGARSGQACHLMAKQGFRVVNLVGGIANWHGQVI